MKAGILTFHGANNYGAVLQAYALTQWLVQNGVEPEIIDYQSSIFEKYNIFRSWQYKKAPYKLGVDIVKSTEKSRRNHGFDAFRKQYLPISKESYDTVQDLDKITDKYDYYICGSDQIWNPNLTNGFDPVYFLDFVTNSCKKIAYAPSIALEKLNEFQLSIIASYLSSFASLSIREQEAIDLVQPYCEQEITKCCDPVFLPDVTCYDKICSDKYSGKEFVFLYVVGRAKLFKNVISYAEEKARNEGLKLYYLIDGDKTLYRIRGRNVFGCDPCVFLSLIKNAKYVVSNSFHATSFAILYSRQFITFLKNETGSRMVSLLQALNLECRIYSDDSSNSSLEDAIDYSEIEHSLQAFRETSSDFLLRALGLVDAPHLEPNYSLMNKRRRNFNELNSFVADRRQAYLVRHRSAEVVAKSRSGGIFTAISDAILLAGGVVYGCRMEDAKTAIHCRATTRAERDLFRGSKYIQSEIGECFKQVRTDLKDGIQVLFSGTGCQIAGLYGFLEGVDTSNLYTVDIICHGTSSPRLWSEYLDWMQKKTGKPVSTVNFRDKRYGWKAHLETVVAGGKLYTTSVYRVLFLKNAFLRPSCFECPFSSLRRMSDITIGDAWGIEKTHSQMNDDKGCSLVMINSERGQELFNDCQSHITVESVDLENYLQPNLLGPSKKPKNRQQYWDCLDTDGFDALANRYGKAGVFRRMRDRQLILLSKNTSKHIE